MSAYKGYLLKQWYCNTAIQFDDYYANTLAITRKLRAMQAFRKCNLFITWRCNWRQFSYLFIVVPYRWVFLYVCVSLCSHATSWTLETIALYWKLIILKSRTKSLLFQILKNYLNVLLHWQKSSCASCMSKNHEMRVQTEVLSTEHRQQTV